MRKKTKTKPKSERVCKGFEIPEEIRVVLSGEKQLRRSDIPKIQDFIAGELIKEGFIKDKSEIWNKVNKNLKKDESKSERLAREFREKHGRNPPKFTPQEIEKLEKAFLDHLNDKEACIYAGVCKTDLYYYLEANPDFAERREALRSNNTIVGKQELSKSIRSGDLNSIKYYLDRINKDEFSTRTETTGKDGEAIEMQVEVTKESIKEVLVLVEQAMKEIDN